VLEGRSADEAKCAPEKTLRPLDELQFTVNIAAAAAPFDYVEIPANKRVLGKTTNLEL
jgi:hypothetical protein